jgi:hypothetical protein
MERLTHYDSSAGGPSSYHTWKRGSDEKSDEKSDDALGLGFGLGLGLR